MATCSFSLRSSSRRNINLRRIEKICCAREMGARLVVRAAFLMSPSPFLAKIQNARYNKVVPSQSA
jgi:hypothetical protein